MLILKADSKVKFIEEKFRFKNCFSNVFQYNLPLLISEHQINRLKFHQITQIIDTFNNRFYYIKRTIFPITV